MTAQQYSGMPAAPQQPMMPITVAPNIRQQQQQPAPMSAMQSHGMQPKPSERFDHQINLPIPNYISDNNLSVVYFSLPPEARQRLLRLSERDGMDWISQIAQQTRLSQQQSQVMIQQESPQIMPQVNFFTRKIACRFVKWTHWMVLYPLLGGFNLKLSQPSIHRMGSHLYGGSIEWIYVH